MHGLDVLQPRSFGPDPNIVGRKAPENRGTPLLVEAAHNGVYPTKMQQRVDLP